MWVGRGGWGEGGEDTDTAIPGYAYLALPGTGGLSRPWQTALLSQTGLAISRAVSLTTTQSEEQAGRNWDKLRGHLLLTLSLDHGAAVGKKGSSFSAVSETGVLCCNRSEKQSVSRAERQSLRQN